MNRLLGFTVLKRVKVVAGDLARMVMLIYDASPTNAIRYLLLVLLQSFFISAVLYVLKQIIDVISSPSLHSLQEVYLLLGSFFFLQFLIVVSGQLNAHYGYIHQQKLNDRLSTEVINKAIAVDYGYYENPLYHDTLHLAQQQALYKSSQLLSGLSNLVLQGSTVVMVGSLLAFYYWQFALLSLLIAIPLFLVKWFFARESFIEEKRVAAQERESNYLQQVLTGVRYAKEVRLFGFGERFIERYKQLRRGIFQRKQSIQNKQNRYSLLIATAEMLLMGAVFFILAKDAWQQLITPGIFVLYLQGFQRFQSSFKGLLQAVVQLFQQRLFVNHLFSFLALPDSTSSSGMPFPSQPQKLEIKGVSFTYPLTRKQVLHNVSISCGKGEIIALVGENGSGKSTLVNILGRLYDGYTGEITVDGSDFRLFASHDFRGKSAFLFQDFEKYFLTIAENISLGSSSFPDPTRIQQAAMSSKAYDFISMLPSGFDTLLGRSFHKGQQLSGGQWQKLALARIFYRDTPFVVLDEPTSSLDAMAEHALYNALRSWGKEKIIILVTHRLAQLKYADRIVVFREGSIVEEGTYTALINQKGYFQQLYGDLR
jgi:ATP-binding cassette subfamily B protein